MIGKDVVIKTFDEAKVDSEERANVDPLPSSLVSNLESFIALDRAKLRYLSSDFLRLHDLVSEVDFSHPDSSSLKDLDSSFFPKIAAVVDVMDYGSRKYVECDFLQPLRQSILDDRIGKKIKKINPPPSQTLKTVRILKDKAALEACRRQKDTQDIGLKVLYNKGSSAFADIPDDLVQYTRFFDLHAEEIKEIERRREYFESHGLTSMAQVIGEGVEQIRRHQKDNAVCDFKRTSMRNVAVTIAKMMVEEFDKKEITWSRSKLHLDGKKYDPLACPWHVFEPQASNEIRSVINHLDSAPEYGGKPLFDHFWVIVPSFEGQGEAFTMLREGKSVGALLGDRDGEVYFICYWAKECYNE